MFVRFDQTLINLNAIGKNFRDDLDDGRVIFRVDPQQCTEAEGTNPSIVSTGETLTIFHPLRKEMSDEGLRSRIVHRHVRQRLEKAIGIQPENDDEHLQQHQTQLGRADLPLESLSDELNDRR